MCNRNKSLGFTLIEFVISVAVAGVLTTVAVPSFTSFIQNNRLVSNANDFISSINLARSEAIKRSKMIVLCKSANATSCDTSTTGWHQGWVVFIDEDNNGVLDVADEVLRSYDTLASGMTLQGYATSGNFGSADNFITYNPSGNSTATNKLELVLCDARNSLTHSKGIRVTASGRPNVVRGSELGSTLTCT